MKGRDYMSKKPKKITINDSVMAFGKMVQIGGAFTEQQAKKYLTDYQFSEYQRLNHFRFSNVRVTKEQLFKMAAHNVISQEELCAKMKDKIITVKIYSLSDKGRNFEQKVLGYDNAHYSNSKYHDVFITAKFNELSHDERMSAKPEAQIREELREKLDDMIENEPEKLQEILNKYEEKLEGFIEKFESDGGYASPVDFSYTSSTSQTMGYEIVTKDYKAFAICYKELCCDVLGYEYEDRRV